MFPALERPQHSEELRLFGGAPRGDELVDRAEVRAGDLADRRVHRVADDGRAGDDRGAEQRAEHDERRLARAPDRVPEREPAQHRSPHENQEERQRDESNEDERGGHTGTATLDSSAPTRRKSLVGDDLAVLHGDQPVGSGGDGGIVRDQDQRQALPRGARRAGPSRRRPSPSRGCRWARPPRRAGGGRRARARSRRAAARRPRAPAAAGRAGARGRPASASRAPARALSFRHAREQERQLDVLGRGEDRDQVERLEDEAHRLGAMPRALRVRELVDRMARRRSRVRRRSRRVRTGS